jgi:hypothetical protein
MEPMETTYLVLLRFWRAKGLLSTVGGRFLFRVCCECTKKAMFEAVELLATTSSSLSGSGDDAVGSGMLQDSMAESMSAPGEDME